MKATLEQAREIAMSLGKNDRRKLRDELNENLDPRPIAKEFDNEENDESRLMRPDMTDDEMFAELERRREEAERDPNACVPVDVFLRQLREKYL